MNGSCGMRVFVLVAVHRQNRSKKTYVYEERPIKETYSLAMRILSFGRRLGHPARVPGNNFCFFPFSLLRNNFCFFHFSLLTRNENSLIWQCTATDKFSHFKRPIHASEQISDRHTSLFVSFHSHQSLLTLLCEPGSVRASEYVSFVAVFSFFSLARPLFATEQVSSLGLQSRETFAPSIQFFLFSTNVSLPTKANWSMLQVSCHIHNVEETFEVSIFFFFLQMSLFLLKRIGLYYRSLVIYIMRKRLLKHLVFSISANVSLPSQANRSLTQFSFIGLFYRSLFRRISYPTTLKEQVQGGEDAQDA